jgi:hypothetical protein
MSDFMDPFPELPQVVDVGGDRYFMGPQKPIELGFKSRQDYLNSFGSDKQTEYLIRKYLFYSLANKQKLAFDDPKEKAALITLLKKRAAKLESSKEFTSSTLKNTLIQRSYLNIQRLIQDLEGADYKGTIMPQEISESCNNAKKYIRQIPEDRVFQLVLEIAWYLLHPDEVPKKVECDWAKLVQDLDTLRLGDLVGQIRGEEDTFNKNAQNIQGNIKKPFNYFKKINLEAVAKAPSKQNALDVAKDMALRMEGEDTNAEMKERLKTLLNILEVKKYLRNDLPVNKDRLKIIDVPAAEQISRSLISNPLRGVSGGTQTMDKPLGIAFNPLFEYFKMVFDPVYSILASSIDRYSANQQKANIKTSLLPQLTALLHICNNLNPGEDGEGSQNTYGVYRITNMDANVISFINKMFGFTRTYLDKFGADDTKKNIFNKQLFQLPKVRLTSLLNRSLNPNVYKDADSIPYIQFFTVGGSGNMTLLDKSTFMTKDGATEEQFVGVQDFFKPSDLYIVCTKSDNDKENIPMNLYEINFDQVDVSDNGLIINSIPENYFNKNKEPAVFLDGLVTLEPYVVYNDAELALSIFILFKELMPK